jgi:hypothetical protein
MIEVKIYDNSLIENGQEILIKTIRYETGDWPDTANSAYRVEKFCDDLMGMYNFSGKS